MPMHGSSHPSKKKPEIGFAEDWTELAQIVKDLGKHTTTTGGNIWDDLETVTVVDDKSLVVLKEFVPRLIEAYTELWGLTAALMKAVEDLEASKDTLYVPDASDMLKGMSNG